DTLFMSNYAQINIFDELSRLPGVGLVSFLGQRQYSMRAWLDPQKLAARDLTAAQVIQPIQEQNRVGPPGNVRQHALSTGQAYQLVRHALGRLTTAEQSGAIVVKAGPGGRLVHLRDVARLELGSQNADLDCAFGVVADGKPVRYPSLAMAVFPLPSANALETA